MPAPGVVKALDVSKYIRSGLLACQIILEMHQLAFEGSEETLNGGVVIAVANGAHAAAEAMFLEQLLIICTGILVTSVRMM